MFSNFIICLRGRKAKKEQKKVPMCWFVPPKPCNIRNWVRLKLAAGKSSWVPHMVAGTQLPEPPPAAPQDAH